MSSMTTVSSYRPALVRPDAGSFYFEVAGPSIPDGMMKGMYLAEYKWRRFDVLVDYTLADTLSKVFTELDLVKTKFPEAKGVVFYFDINEEGTYTCAEIFVDLELQETRQVLYSISTRKIMNLQFESFPELVVKTSWLQDQVKKEIIGEVSSISTVTYRKFDDNYNGRS